MNRRQFIKKMGIVPVMTLVPATVLSNVIFTEDLRLDFFVSSKILNDIEKQIKTVVHPRIFGDYNDDFTRDTVNSILNDYVKSSYHHLRNNISFVCNDGNNTPMVIDNGELVVDCIIDDNITVTKKRFTLGRGDVTSGMTLVGYDGKVF